MSSAVGFGLFLALTLVLLGAVVRTGLARRRHTHVKLVVSAIVSLGVTIWWAEQLGDEYDLASAGRITPVHLFIAKVTVVAYLLPIATGVWTWFDVSRRKLHAPVAWAVLALTVLTAVTGTWMVLASERLPG